MIMLTDSSKFRQKGFSRIRQLHQVDIIVTNTGVNEMYVNQLEEKGVEVIRV